MKEEICIVWFRQDLRISDNPTILAASMQKKVLPIYIFDDCAPEGFKIGGASKIWLHHSLDKLNQTLKGNLNLYLGESDKIIELLIQRYNVKSIFWNRCYEPWYVDQENAVKEICNKTSTKFEVFNSNYLYLPDQVLKENKEYYKVFTAYKNKLHSIPYRRTVNIPDNLGFFRDDINTLILLDLGLLPKNHWHKNLKQIFDVGEIEAQNKLDYFIKNNLCGYKDGRNFPHMGKVSKLSSHLHFGEISPSQVLESINGIGSLYANTDDIEHFVSEIMWREFSCYLLYHFPELHGKNFNSQFNSFPWENNLDLFQRWAKGKTGYPLIDAGMRELWQTGYIHNRVRMVAASFLIKNLNIHWRQGMEWFWDCLLDADLANNSASWQWVAGSGMDAAPYFRIFNPIIQGEKFDSDGKYTKKFVPELENLPSKYLFKPWEAPEKILKDSGVILGINYPKPIVDFKSSRERALSAYKALN